MSATIAFHGIESGRSFRVVLTPFFGGESMNPSGTTATEMNARQYYALITGDVPVGRYQADVLLDGIVVGGGPVDVSGTGTYWIGNIKQDVEVDIDVGDVSDEVAEKVTASLSSQKQIVLTQPALTGNRLSSPIVQGDSYLFNADPSLSRSIDFARADFPDLSGASVELVATLVTDSEPTTITVAGSIVSATGTKRVRFQPTSEQTKDWPVGSYLFNVLATFSDGNTACFVGPKSQMEVIPRANPVA